MTGTGRFAKWRLSAGAPQHPLRGFDMHALDHLIAKALGAAVEGGDQGFGTLDLGRAWRKRLMARRDLAGMNQALAVEAKPTPLLRLLQETGGIVEAVEHAIEGGDSGGARSQHDHLQRRGNRFARRIE